MGHPPTSSSSSDGANNSAPRSGWITQRMNLYVVRRSAPRWSSYHAVVAARGKHLHLSPKRVIQQPPQPEGTNNKPPQQPLPQHRPHTPKVLNEVYAADKHQSRSLPNLVNKERLISRTRTKIHKQQAPWKTAANQSASCWSLGAISGRIGNIAGRPPVRPHHPPKSSPSCKDSHAYPSPSVDRLPHP